jgi:4-amino-4-deoxy-L-arabinose transferase-like glycosyltransferase
VSLLMNIAGKSTRELCFGQLVHNQAAPPMFLAVQRGLALTIGVDELTQRLLPVLASVAALPLFAALAWRLMPAPGAFFATLLLCLSDKLIWYGAELKQYSSDLLFSLILLWIAVRAIQRGKPMLGILQLSVFAAVAVWFSHPVILVFGGLAIVLALQARRDVLRKPLTAVLYSLPLLVSFVTLYLISIRHQSADRYLQDFWAEGYVDWSRPARVPLWLLGRSWGTATYVLAPAEFMGALLLPLVLIAAIDWWKSEKMWLVGLCLAPLVMNLVAAAVHKYPFSGARVNLYLVPGLVLLAGGGIAALFQWLSARPHLPPPVRRGVPAILGVAIAALPLTNDLRRLVHPRNKGNMAPVAAYLRANRRPGQPIYAVRHGLELEWYWPDAPPPVIFETPSVSPPSYWMVFSCSPEEQRAETRGRIQAAAPLAHPTGKKFEVPGGAAIEMAANQGM